MTNHIRHSLVEVAKKAAKMLWRRLELDQPIEGVAKRGMSIKSIPISVGK